MEHGNVNTSIPRPRPRCPTHQHRRAQSDTHALWKSDLHFAEHVKEYAHLQPMTEQMSEGVKRGMTVHHNVDTTENDTSPTITPAMDDIARQPLFVNRFTTHTHTSTATHTLAPPISNLIELLPHRCPGGGGALTVFSVPWRWRRSHGAPFPGVSPPAACCSARLGQTASRESTKVCHHHTQPLLGWQIFFPRNNHQKQTKTSKICFEDVFPSGACEVPHGFVAPTPNPGAVLSIPNDGLHACLLIPGIIHPQIDQQRSFLGDKLRNSVKVYNFLSSCFCAVNAIFSPVQTLRGDFIRRAPARAKHGQVHAVSVKGHFNRRRSVRRSTSASVGLELGVLCVCQQIAHLFHSRAHQASGVKSRCED